MHAYGQLLLPNDVLILSIRLIQHRHLHKHRRDLAADMEKRGQWITATNDFGKGPEVFSFWSDSPAETTSAPDAAATNPSEPAERAAVATSTPASSAAASASSSAAPVSSSGDSGASSAQKVDSKISMTDAYGNEFAEQQNQFGTKTVSEDAPADQQWLYKGNFGNPYASNMIYLNGSQLSQFHYTNTFKNNGTDQIGVRIWNKVGKDNQPNSGQCDAKPALHFKLGGGESKVVAFDEDSQVAWSQDNCPKNGDGSPECTWGEANFDDTHHEGAGSYDVTMVHAGSTIQYMGITGNINNQNTCSSIYENAFHVGQENIKNGPQPGVNWGGGLDIHLMTFMTSLTLSAPP